jgi:hypothetical protein
LPKPPPEYSYHVFLDNLLVSIKMVEYAHLIGIVVTATCRYIGGVIQELLELKNKDKKYVIPWGMMYSFPTASGKVCHIG